MKIKVSETTNTQLDWLVAKCEGKNGVLHDDGITRCIVIVAASGLYKGIFKPTENWSQGGPIIEREKISVMHILGSDHWIATTYVLGERTPRGEGQTPLIAAMRCFVASRLGDEVEVPEELV